MESKNKNKNRELKYDILSAKIFDKKHRRNDDPV